MLIARLVKVHGDLRLAAVQNWRLIGVLCLAFLLGALVSAFALRTHLPDRVMAKLQGWQVEAPGDRRDFAWTRRETGLQSFELTEISLGEVDGGGTGGGLAEFEGRIVFATAWGRIGVVDLAVQKLSYIGPRLPMNLDVMRESEAWTSNLFNRNWFRTHDLIVMSDPEGASHLYASHHVYRDGKICLTVSRTAISASDDAIELSTWETVYEADPCIDLLDVTFNFDGHMSGGRMLPEAAGAFLMTIGDFGFGGRKGRDALVVAESGNELAKLVRIDPVLGQSEIVAAGIRNAQGLARDHLGRIWMSEHAAQGGDEVNLLKPGADYGWPKVSLGVEYAEFGRPRTPIRPNPVQGRHEGFQAPVFAFMPSVGVSNMLAMPDQAEAFELWSGDLLLTTLKAQTIYRLRLEGDRIIYSEPIEIGRRIRDIIQLPDGQIALFTDARSVILMRDPGVHGQNEDMITLSGYEEVVSVEPISVYASGSFNGGAEIFRLKCGACHTMDGEPSVAPSLAGIIGRPIGSEPGFAYSRELSDAQGEWTRRRLATFLRDPATAGLSGTSMPSVDGLGPRPMDQLLDYLAENDR